MRVDICICTYQRPDGLAACLASINAQDVANWPDVDVRVVVIDNDVAGSARKVHERMASTSRWPMQYVHEANRGITYARARAVLEARADADWIAFIDDDEQVAQIWLAAMLATQSAHDASIVAGPVVPRLAADVPEWLARSAVFDRQRHSTGTIVSMTGTGNVLVRASLLRDLEQPFDHRFALSGGEDTHLFLRLAAAGEHIVWADEAIVTEDVPPTRARVSWLVRRSWRGGMTFVHCERAVHPGWRTAINRAARGSFRIMRGVLLAVSGLVRGRSTLLRGVLLAVNGAGVIAGLAGGTYAEYRQTHGS